MNDDPISERAIRASSQHRQDMRALELGLGGTRLMEALAAAQAELPAVIEAKKKGARGKYAPLEDLLRDIKPILLKHKLMMRQGQERSHGADDGGTKTRIYPVFTDIIHWPSGEMHRTTIDVHVLRWTRRALAEPSHTVSAIRFWRLSRSQRRMILLMMTGLQRASESFRSMRQIALSLRS